MNKIINFQIFNGLPYHSQKDISEFLGRSTKTINEHLSLLSKNNFEIIDQPRLEGERRVVRSIKHYNYKIAAGLCSKFGTFEHTQLYRLFLESRGIVWPHELPVFYNERNFRDSLSLIFKDILVIKFEYKVDRYRLDGFIEELNLALELDGPNHSSSSQSKKDKLREEFIKKKIPGIRFIRASFKDYVSIANQIIKIYLIKQESLVTPFIN